MLRRQRCASKQACGNANVPEPGVIVVTILRGEDPSATGPCALAEGEWWKEGAGVGERRVRQQSAAFVRACSFLRHRAQRGAGPEFRALRALL